MKFIEIANPSDFLLSLLLCNTHKASVSRDLFETLAVDVFEDALTSEIAKLAAEQQPLQKMTKFTFIFP